MITIRSHSHEYTVRKEHDLKNAIAGFAAQGKVFALVDDFLLQQSNAAAFNQLPAENIFAIRATEENKSFDRLTPVFSWFLERGFRRDCTLLVAGGGVTQDIACFIATVLLRGISWHFIPTTLLAQCDSCIGSKSSINLGKYKNQIGSFYPPRSIVCVDEVLKTLPRDEVRSGLGEAIKLHLLHGAEKYQWIRKVLEDFHSPGFALSDIVWSCLEIKKPFIEEDEFDRGRRNLLNYGHTFGHAYESATGYAIPHGIAVILGVLTATFISVEMGWVPAAHRDELHEWLRPFFSPYEELLKKIDVGAVVAAIKLDKKNVGGRINCILTRGPGLMERTAIDSIESLHLYLAKFFRWIES